jgi:Relaxase/Mobilisation nuclease domain
MIAKGNTHDNGPKLVAYILTAQEGERVEFGSARGFDFFGRDVLQAATIMQQIADHTTNCRDAWFHTQTRLAPGEQLNRDQWERTLDREEKRLGFSGHARAWSFHIDEANGEKHLHAVWFRIDPETNRAHDPGLFKLRLMEVARWAEKEFHLRELSNARQPHDRARAPERSEMEESRRLGTDVRAIRTAILDCLERADGGKAFKAALEERGLMLANGDRRDCFVVVDQAGGLHSLGKKLTGQTLAETRARLADLDRSQLPDVEQAQDIQRERLSQIEWNAEPQAADISLAAHQITEPHSA